MMNLLETVSDWVRRNIEDLNERGEVSLVVGPKYSKSSVYLVVEISEDRDAELIVWDSGEIELLYGSYSDPVQEHIET